MVESKKMKALLISVLLLSSSLVYSQNTLKIDSITKPEIKIELKTPGDTLSLHKPFLISILIINLSEHEIYIPREIDFISNLYPNGINEVWEGATLKLIIEPIPNFSSIIIENDMSVTSTSFIRLKPNTTIDLPVIDLSNYIGTFNTQIEDLELKLNLGQEYSLQLSYSNYRIKSEHKTFLGTVLSEKQTVFFKN